ncbi:nitrite reductase (NADH) small subunit [uncultured bacterium]|nr:nitrite reductase (NADH) small subunit [uncultured bacterium]
MQWQTVCNISRLIENAGVCALVDGIQIAIFYLPETDLKVYAISNYDPIGKIPVLSRGIVGDMKGWKVVASPLYKHHFCIETGVCLENEAISVPIYACRINGDKVQVDTRVIAPLKQLVLDEVAA